MVFPLKLLLLPGLDGTGTLFTPLLDWLSLTPVVARYPLQKLSYGALLEQLLDGLPEGPFALVAESFSGPLAIRLAYRRPPGLRALVLVSSFARFPWLRWAPVWPWMFGRVPERALGWALTGGDRRVTESLAAVVRSVPPEVLAFRVRQLLRADVRRQLRECPVPRLLLQGREDRLLRRPVWPGTVLVPGPHLLLQRYPQQSAGLIEAWLGSL